MFRILLIAALILPAPVMAAAQTAAVQLPDFTYQGRLERAGQLVDGSADLIFTLWDSVSGGTQLGTSIIENAYPVDAGLFTISLSFPGTFVGEQRYLQVSVDGTVLPRQAIATAPVAQYAMSGATGPQGAAGTTGQSVSTAYGTGQLVLSAAANYTLIPGLTQTISVPSNATVFITSDGGAQHTSTAINSSSVVDIGIYVDGVLVPSAGQRRVVMSNTQAVGQMIGNWNMSVSRPLAAGSHTIQVRAANVGTFTANVSGSAPQMQGQLTVMVIKH